MRQAVSALCFLAAAPSLALGEPGHLRQKEGSFCGVPLDYFDGQGQDWHNLKELGTGSAGSVSAVRYSGTSTTPDLFEQRVLKISNPADLAKGKAVRKRQHSVQQATDISVDHEVLVSTLVCSRASPCPFEAPLTSFVGAEVAELPHDNRLVFSPVIELALKTQQPRTWPS